MKREGEAVHRISIQKLLELKIGTDQSIEQRLPSR